MNAKIIWHHAQTQETQIWFMNGARVASTATVLGETGKPTFIGPPFRIVGVGDFNGDGNADILWHNAETHETQIWFMNRERVAFRATVLGETGKPTFIGPPFSIVGVGDFNKDGNADILWHNAETQETQIWFMNRERVAGRATVLGETGKPTFIGPPFSIVGVGDFNNDGNADILWHNAETQETQIWLMNGARVAGRATVLGETGKPTFIGPPFSIVGVSSILAPPVVPPIPAFRPYRFNIDSVDIQTQKADGDHSDSDWLTLFITVTDPAVKSDAPIQSKMFHLGGRIRTGDHITGEFRSDLFTAKDTDLVTVTYLIVNLGSTDAEAQFAEAVKITNKIVDDVGPILGAAIGLFAGNPAAGIELSGKIVDAFDKVITIAGDAFDLLGIHFAPANCNGEVLHDTVSYQPGQLAQAANKSESRFYRGSQENDRCGAPPEYRVNFSLQHFSDGGLFEPPIR
jgi:FG-GAP-like repeat